MSQNMQFNILDSLFFSSSFIYLSLILSMYICGQEWKILWIVTREYQQSIHLPSTRKDNDFLESDVNQILAKIRSDDVSIYQHSSLFFSSVLNGWTWIPKHDWFITNVTFIRPSWILKLLNTIYHFVEFMSNGICIDILMFWLWNYIYFNRFNCFFCFLFELLSSVHLWMP